jgi:hypothetical protein
MPNPSHSAKRGSVVSLTIFFLVLLSTGLSGYYVWQGCLHGFDKYLPILCSTLLLDGLGVFALVFKVSFETRRRAIVPFIASLLLIVVCAVHLVALANARVGAISQDEADTRARSLDDSRHARNVGDANALVQLNCAQCSPERKQRMYQAEMSRLEKSQVNTEISVNSQTPSARSWGRRYVEDYATAVQLIFGLLAGVAMLINNFLRMYAPEPAPEFIWPDELKTVERRAPARRENLVAPAEKPVENFTEKKETAKKHASFNSEGLALLRDALKLISFRLPGFSFKSYVRGDAVWILMMKANRGTQETAASAKAKLAILDEALTMAPDAFRARLERFLKQNGFAI